jgi:hypothetical protein
MRDLGHCRPRKISVRLMPPSVRVFVLIFHESEPFTIRLFTQRRDAKLLPRRRGGAHCV